MYGLNKYMIDINIETLAGTTFSLKVSPLEPIQSVKAKIQRLEGIPISHQHLVWKTTELDDSSCLNDYNIQNGATIKMVLALRGGPINTRRMTTEDSLLRDVSDLMEIREDSNLWNNNDSSQSMNKHVTLLLFRDGDHLNLLRVIDRGDATSPISGAMSAASMYVPYDEIDHERLATTNQEELNANETIETDVTNKISKISKSKNKKLLTNENEKTREKMIALRDKMNEYKKSKAKKKSIPIELSSQSNTANIQDKTTTMSTTTTTDNNINKSNEDSNLINKNSTDESAEATSNKHKQQTAPVIMQSSLAATTSTKINQIKATNNLRMKRFQILGDSKIIQNEIISTTPKKMSTAQPMQATNDSSKINSSEKSSNKTKLTTIYTTTDRNGQVFIKRIHENYSEYDDDEDDEDSEEGVEDDDGENYDDEDSDVDDEEDDEENYEEECPDYENNLLKNYNCYYDDEYFVDDDEDDSEDNVDDDEEDNENNDDEDDEEDDEDDIDDDIDDEEMDDDNEQQTNCVVFHNQPIKNYAIKIKNNLSQLDVNSKIQQESEYDNADGVTMYGEEDENYDEDEHELLLNKSELLIAEDRQINNSPNSGGGNGNGGNRSTDLMTMMMMMTLNGDQISSAGIAGGISSSLATTALPTIITPMYTTDNENFVLPPTRSAIKKLKSIRGSNKKSENYSNQMKLHKSRKIKSLNKINNILDVIQIETKNQIKYNNDTSSNAAAASVEQNINKQNFDEIEKLKQIENIIQEEKFKRQILKQKRKKRQLQINQSVELMNQQDNKKSQEIDNVNVENQQLNKEQSESDVLKETDDQLIARKNTNRRRRRREYQIENTQPNISFSSILLLPEEIENLKKRVKEGNAIKQNRQIRNQANLKIINDKQLILDNEQTNSKTSENKNEQIMHETNKNQADESFVDEMKSEANENNNKVIINNNMPSNLQKRVSFIVTPNDDDKNSNETNENLININNMTNTTPNNNNNNIKGTNPIMENNYYNIDKMKKILKLSNNSPSRNNALQAKVYKTYETENGVQPMKPLLLANYKQKPPPKLDSLYSSNEIVTNVNSKTLYSNQQHQQQQQQQEIIQEQNYGTRVTLNNENDYNDENRTRLIKNPYTNNEITQNRMQQQPNLLMKRNSSAIRNVATPTSSPTISSNLNRLDVLKTNSSYAGNPAVKTYPNPLTYSSNVRINSKPNLINDSTTTTTTTTMEPLRLYSASSKNKSISISSNLNEVTQSKSLKLPPVINTNNSTSSNNNNNNNGTNIIIGGSTNNLTSIGLNETTSKKKINDLSRYCYFCQRKTGLVSSYICRCGNNYCTQHRNAEAHNCTYDYKTEGRKLIEHANPLVAAPKLPKI